MTRGTRPEVRLAVNERRKLAVDMRLAGTDYLTIGAALHRTSGNAQIPNVEAHGYGARIGSKTLANEVSRDIIRALDVSLRNTDVAADELRRLVNDRLERLLRGVWYEALHGSAQHARTALRIIAEQSRLHGLNAPLKIEALLADEPTERRLAEAFAEVAEAYTAGAAAGRETALAEAVDPAP